MRFAGIPWWAVTGLVAACATVLAVLHLLRVRPREVRVITTLFWTGDVEPTRARTLLHHFRHPWTYALLLLTCTLLALALGEPELTARQTERVHRVIVLNGGAAMRAPEATSGGARFDAACQYIVSAIEQSPSDEPIALIAADPWPRLVHRFEDPRPWLRLRLAELKPADRPSALRDAIRVARSLVAGKSRPKLVLVTDRSPSDWRGANAPSDDDLAREGILDPANVEVVRVAGPADNAAILSAMYEPHLDQPFRGRFRVRAGYWGEQPREVRLRVRRGGGAPLLADTAILAPGQAHDFVLDDVPADGDELEVELTPGDALPVDDRVAYRLPLRAPIRVAIGQAVPRVLRLAIEHDPAALVVKAAQPHDITVCTQDEDRGEAGGALAVVTSGPEAATGRPINVAARSRLVEGLDFEDARCGTGAAVPRREGAEALLAADTTILASLSGEPSSMRLELASALVADDSGAPRRPAFAIFVARAVRRLAGWEDDGIVLVPERVVEDPLWAEQAGEGRRMTVMPASRESGNLSGSLTDRQATSGAARGLWTPPRLSEALLLLGLCGLLVEATLHIRGRIS